MSEIPIMTRAELLALPRAPEGLSYIAIGPYCWGRSPDAVKALDCARREGAAGVFTLSLFNSDCEVDQVNGGVYYNSKLPGVRPNIGKARMR